MHDSMGHADAGCTGTAPPGEGTSGAVAQQHHLLLCQVLGKPNLAERILQHACTGAPLLFGNWCLPATQCNISSRNILMERLRTCSACKPSQTDAAPRHPLGPDCVDQSAYGLDIGVTVGCQAVESIPCSRPATNQCSLPATQIPC